MSRAESLRIALLCYRGNPHCGGQGVYTRHLSSELVKMGHRVTVFAGQPYPVLEDCVDFEPVPSLDLYRPDNPFRVPWPWEFKSSIDLLEFAIMCTAGFPEPRTFSLRIRRLLSERRGEFDIVHDNQCLGPGLLGVMEDGFPLLTTLHHPITVDRQLDLSHARNAWRRFTLRRWYGFVEMQKKVAAQLPHVVTVSQSSRRDIVGQMGVPESRISVIPVGVDHKSFRPMPEVPRIPGRIMTTTSSDIPLKGLSYLLEALAKVRTEREAELVVVGKPREGSKIPATIDRLGLNGSVKFVTGIDESALVRLFAEAEMAVVPSLYEGFSLPAIEAMACGVPLLSTTGGALPEVVGEHKQNAYLVPPGDPSALAVG
ncbi:MAG: glycosyltransferase family 4 protein, partial [Acidimicrobiia bacterium]